MNRQTQSARAYIRRGKSGIWQSHVNLMGRAEKLSTGTRIRTAALEFNLIHLRQLLDRRTRSTLAQPAMEPSHEYLIEP